MKLTALKPIVGALNTAKARPLTETPGATQRLNGRTWTTTRKRVALARGYRCHDCGRTWRPHIDHIDHDVPLERGGLNDDANLVPRCLDCHAAKTAREAGERAQRRAGL